MSYGPNLMGNQVSNSSPYAVSASIELAEAFQAWKAFDAAGITTWFANDFSDANQGWLKVDFGVGNARKVAQYILNHYPEADFDIDSWVFEGSNDDVSWTALDTQTGQRVHFADGEIAYDFANHTTYRYYRLRVTLGGTSGRWVIRDLQYRESTRIGSPMITSFND